MGMIGWKNEGEEVGKRGNKSAVGGKGGKTRGESVMAERGPVNNSDSPCT